MGRLGMKVGIKYYLGRTKGQEGGREWEEMEGRMEDLIKDSRPA
jgi:hypothetical protein